MRQASLGLENLKRELAKPKTRLPKCLIVNEIGMFFILEGDEEAEDILAGFLKDKEVNEKFIAFCWLCSVRPENLKEETREKLRVFKENPENEELVDLSKKAIHHFRMPRFKQESSELLLQTTN